MVHNVHGTIAMLLYIYVVRSICEYSQKTFAVASKYSYLIPVMASEAFLSIGTVTQGKTAKAIFTYLDLYCDAFMQYTEAKLCNQIWLPKL